MMQESPELEAVSRRIVAAIFSADGETVAGFLANEDPLVFCGSADEELTTGDELRTTYEAHINEFPVTEISNLEVLAYEGPEFGWSLCVCDARPETIDHRIGVHLTFVFSMEKGSWKVSHIHNSIAVSNEAVLGYEHVAMKALLDAARKDDPFQGQTGMATVMFTDIAGSTALAASLGDDSWSRTIGTHFEFVTDVVEKMDGRLVKSLGDGTMSAFSSAGAAMRAAVAIQTDLAAQSDEPVLSVRIGMHSGDVVAAADDFFGTVVNRAARITSQAEPGEILLSDATRLMVGGASGFNFSRHRKVKLAGFEGQTGICRLEWAPS